MKVVGLKFQIPLGDAGTGAQLLIANPLTSATPAIVDVFAPPTAVVTTGVQVEIGQVKSVALPSSAVGSEVIVAVTNGIPVIVQLAIAGRGQEFSQTYAEPTA